MTGILIADDSMTIRLSLRRILDAVVEPAEIFEAATPDETVDLFRAQRPELVFLDLVLGPGGDGMRVLSTLLDDDPRAKVVVITGLPEEHPTVIEAISLGAAGYLRKPLYQEPVRRAIEAATA